MAFMDNVVSIKPPAGMAAARGRVLTTATLRAAEALDLRGQDLAAVLGVSGAVVSRMRSGAYTLGTTAKSFELAALFVRLYRALDAITGGDRAVARAWMRADNTALGGVPLERIKTVSGLVNGLAYLDSRRAPL